MIITTNNNEIETVLNQVKKQMQYMFNPNMEHYFNTPQVILGNVLKTNVMLHNRTYLLHVLTEYNIDKNRLEIGISMENRKTQQVAYADTKRIIVLNVDNTVNLLNFEDYINETVGDMIKHF